MIIKFREGTEQKDIAELKAKLRADGFELHESVGETYTILGLIGDTSKLDPNSFYAYSFIDSVVRIQEPYKKVNRKFKLDDTIVDVGGVKIGGNNVVLIAGPCAIETPAQIDLITHLVQDAGAKVIRGGAFKPRTSPYSLQGLGIEGL